MARITVTRQGDRDEYLVQVDAKRPTEHQVGLEPAYCEALTGGRIAPEALIRLTFEFLLEREGNEDILRRFKLEQVGFYFPEFETVIRERVQRSEKG